MSDDPVIRMATKRLPLGRGLGALLGESRREEPLVTGVQTCALPIFGAIG